MDMERINPSGLARPSGFSHAVSAPAGRLVFLAGQIGMDRDRPDEAVDRGTEAQSEEAAVATGADDDQSGALRDDFGAPGGESGALVHDEGWQPRAGAECAVGT